MSIVYKYMKIYTRYPRYTQNIWRRPSGCGPRTGAGPGSRRLAAAWYFVCILYNSYLFIYIYIYLYMF